MIYLLYQSPWPVGGSTSYTVHLRRVLGNDNAEIVRIGKRTEGGLRQLSDFGVHYRIMSWEDIKRLRGPLLLTASNHKLDENIWVEFGKMRNTWVTYHDTNEFKLYPHWKHVAGDRVICIRQTGLTERSLPRRPVFIPHPYMSAQMPAPVKRNKVAISIARTSSTKHSEIILAANRKLPVRLQVRLYGELNRMWYAHYLRKHYPEFKPYTGYPRTWGAGVDLCRTALYMVDLTVFPRDGGGTQYTLLEAMDGGAVPIMSENWVSYPGPARHFGPAVSTPEELVQVLKNVDMNKIIRQRVLNTLYLRAVHDVDRIREQYLTTLKGAL